MLTGEIRNKVDKIWDAFWSESCREGSRRVRTARAGREHPSENTARPHEAPNVRSDGRVLLFQREVPRVEQV